MFYCQFDERNFPPGFAFRLAVLVEIIFVVIVSSIAIPTEAEMVRNDCPFSVI